MSHVEREHARLHARVEWLETMNDLCIKEIGTLREERKALERTVAAVNEANAELRAMLERALDREAAAEALSRAALVGARGSAS